LFLTAELVFGLLSLSGGRQVPSRDRHSTRYAPPPTFEGHNAPASENALSRHHLHAAIIYAAIISTPPPGGPAPE
jgi:hypothetical protein